MLRINASRVTAVLAALAPALVVVPAIAAAQRGDPRDAMPPAAWLESGPALAPGQPTELGYELPPDGYLTILRATTDGDLSVVYPSVPNSRSSRRSRGAIPLRADPAPGVGHLFWVVSPTPFDFRQYAGRDGHWMTGAFGGRSGDPFEQVDRFARGTTRGRYSVGYSSYRVGARGGGDRAPAVHDPGFDGDGYARPGYDPLTSGGYMGGYDAYGGYWGSPGWNGYATDTWRHRESWRGREYERAYRRAANADPRSRYLRHCADGTLAPYTVPCGAPPRGTHPPR